jgi:hypothetical protein
MALSWRRAVSCIVILAVALTTASCDTMNVPSVHYLLDTGPDSCGDQRKALDSYGNYFARDMVAGAAAGALVAGGTALILHRDFKTSVMIILTGLAIGAAGGYWKSVTDKETNMQARYRLVEKDVQAENTKVDGAHQAFNRLVDCRRRQAVQIRADVKAGRLSHDDGDKQIKEVRARYDDDIAIANGINKDMASHAANLEYANEQFKPQPYVTVHPAIVYADKNTGSANLSSYKTGAVISGAAIEKNWIKVTLSGGRPGYVQASDVELQAARLAKDKKTRQAPPAAAKGDPVAEGVFTNLSKRADFDDSVQVAAANTSGFELSGG